MIWKDLSLSAKSILEWLINIHDDRLHEITLVPGKRPLRDGRMTKFWPDPVSPEVFDEIGRFAEADDQRYAVKEITPGLICLKLAATGR